MNPRNEDIAVTVSFLVLASIWHHKPITLLVWIGAAIILRMLFWCGQWSLAHELALFTSCTVLGSLNDWNTVDVQHVYSYSVPTLISWSSIPLWMFLFWGMILRTMVGLFDEYDKRVGLLSWTHVVTAAAVIIPTRLTTYVFYEDPLVSWLSYVLAIVVYAIAARPTMRGTIIALIITCAGILAEIFMINIAHLHSYHLGVVWGVPLWIILWWFLASLVMSIIVPRTLNRFFYARNLSL